MPEAALNAGPTSRRSWTLALFVGLAALLWFGGGVSTEPHFVDESAFFSQAFYADLWLSGRRDDPAWLEYPALDLPPLPKYLIGIALRIGGDRRPGRDAARRWYADTSARFETAETLARARWPSAVCGALGCVAIFGLGMLARDRRVGVVAAVLLAVNPLYRLHARRAMADVPAEALILAATAVGLWAWRATLAGRGGLAIRLAAVGGAGVLGGLAVLAKLNGGLGLMVLVAWGLLAVALPGVATRRKAEALAAPALAGFVAFGTFVALDPMLTARPARPSPTMLPGLADQGLWQRVGAVIAHRVVVSRTGQVQFPHDSLRTPAEKIAAVAVQGFGRFGPFGPAHSDSTRRYDWSQDWGGLIWGPWVGVGLIWGLAAGRRQHRAGGPPTAWAVTVQTLVALATVTAFIPLAWDRYYLSIQPGAALLAAGAAVAAGDGVARIRGERGRQGRDRQVGLPLPPGEGRGEGRVVSA
jgi:4-amino-4-deoxy-L-arabinose transferase-like glycosyltransferase